jgi:predicted dehydrogenase
MNIIEEPIKQLRKIRWGILSAAMIARKNWRAFSQSQHSTLVAVAAREQSKARQFIVECHAQFPILPEVDAIAGYAELLARSDIDAVYIPLPTGLRKEWILKAFKSGKHVLSEKPVAISIADMNEISQAARESGKQFMDGVMFAHSGRLAAIEKSIHQDKSVGNVRRVVSQFSFKAGDDFTTSNIRSQSELEPLGCLGDLGWYNVRFILSAMNWDLPTHVVGKTLVSFQNTDSSITTGVPAEFSGELFFDRNRTASVYCSFLSELQQWSHVSGDLGHLTVDDFVLPYFGSSNSFVTHSPVFHIRNGDCRMEDRRQTHTTNEYSEGHPTAQEVSLFDDFSRLVLDGEPDYRWLEYSEKTQGVVDALKRSADSKGAVIQVN